MFSISFSLHYLNVMKWFRSLLDYLPTSPTCETCFFFSYPGFSGERNSYIFTETPNFKVLKSMIILRLTPFNVFVYLPIPTQPTMFVSIGNL